MLTNYNKHLIVTEDQTGIKVYWNGKKWVSKRELAKEYSLNMAFKYLDKFPTASLIEIVKD